MQGLQDFSLDPEDNEKKDAISLDGLTRQELLDLHAKIEQKIGGTNLGDVNLVKEVLMQVHRAKALQETASTEKGVPMNQRAQVQNSLAAMLTQLAKIQAELYSSERVKRIQAAVIKTIKRLPEKDQNYFFELLEGEFAQAAKETDEIAVV